MPSPSMRRFPRLMQYKVGSEFAGIVVAQFGPRDGLVVYIPADKVNTTYKDVHLFDRLSPLTDQLSEFNGSVILRSIFDPILGP